MIISSFEGWIVWKQTSPLLFWHSWSAFSLSVWQGCRKCWTGIRPAGLPSCRLLWSATLARIWYLYFVSIPLLPNMRQPVFSRLFRPLATPIPPYRREDVKINFTFLILLINIKDSIDELINNYSTNQLWINLSSITHLLIYFLI